MARYIGPKLRISRKFGEPILGNPEILKKKNYPPGQHKKQRRSTSEYGAQLLEKQKAKYIYGLLERQFYNLFKKSVAVRKGVTGDILLQKLESRLDNVVFRLALAPTRAAARQLVTHQHILVNNKPVNIPSFALKAGDIIGLAPKARNLTVVHTSLARPTKHPYPWLVWDQKTMQGTFAALPKRNEIPELIQEKSIIELYSK